MKMYVPDSWVIIWIKETPDSIGFGKVLAGWSGSYLQGDSWRMNSGITKVKEHSKHWEFFGQSGSSYNCHKQVYGLKMSTGGVWAQIKENEEFEGQYTLLPEDTDWSNIDW